MKEDKHILTMLVENEPGVTARVSGLFASRGYNIETICGAPTANPKMSRITISTQANPELLERIMKQVRRLVNVIKVRDMTGEEIESALLGAVERSPNIEVWEDHAAIDLVTGEAGGFRACLGARIGGSGTCLTFQTRSARRSASQRRRTRSSCRIASSAAAIRSSPT